LADIAGEFANELIDQRVRYDLERETRHIRTRIVDQAFAEADIRKSDRLDVSSDEGRSRALLESSHLG
jgi:hypothetical protein